MEKIPKNVVTEVAQILKTTIAGRWRNQKLAAKSSYSSDAIWKAAQQLRPEQLFDIYHDRKDWSGRRTQEKPICQHCQGPTTFLNSTAGYYRFCSTTCSVRNTWATADDKYVKDRQSKCEETMTRNYGVSHPMKVEEVKAKMHATMNERYGAHATMLSPVLKRDFLEKNFTPDKRKAYVKKAQETWKSSFGTPERRSKAQKENLKNMTSQRRETLHETIRKNPGVCFTNRYKQHKILIRGRSFTVQGYEHHVIKYLVNKRGVDVNSISIYPKAVPYTEKGRTRMYTIDMKAKIANKWYMIEVKSLYTAGLLSNRTLFYNLRRKVKAVTAAGFRARVIIYDAKSKVFHEIDDLHTKGIREIRQLVME